MSEQSYWASRATLGGISWELPVGRAQLLEQLKRLGPLSIDAPPADTHPLLSELWTVCEGRATPVGLDLGKAALGLAHTAAGVSGALFGASLAWWSGLASGSRRATHAAGAIGEGARRGYQGLSELVSRPLAEVSRAVSLGPYHELLLGVPDVCVGNDSTRHLLVLTMVTDSRLALTIDTSFGYGYAKRLGAFEVADAGSWSVSEAGSPLLRTELAPKPLRADLVQRVNDWWAQPLLGRLQSGGWTSCRFERRLEFDGPACCSLTGSVSYHGERFPLALLPGKSPVSSAIGFARLATRISYPRALRPGPGPG